MDYAIARKRTPEEQELDKKLAELALLEAELAQRELELATTQAELHAFEREYLGVVGIRQNELERIEAAIAEYMAYLESNRDFKPSDSLKKLYREVAKSIHPDLTTDEAERSYRQQLMAEANLAYENGDEEKLLEILQGWERRPESVKGEGVAAELIRAIRQIYQSQERLKAIQAEIESLTQTDLYQLQAKVRAARIAGRNLIAEMASQLDEQINAAKQELEKLKARL